MWATRTGSARRLRCRCSLRVTVRISEAARSRGRTLWGDSSSPARPRTVERGGLVGQVNVSLVVPAEDFAGRVSPSIPGKQEFVVIPGLCHDLLEVWKVTHPVSARTKANPPPLLSRCCHLQSSMDTCARRTICAVLWSHSSSPFINSNHITAINQLTCFKSA